MPRIVRGASALFFLSSVFVSYCQAQSSTGNAPEARNPSQTPEPAAKLDDAEASLSRRYSQFERTLIQMAEYLRKIEPERAELLIRTIGKSREDRIIQQMDQVTELLKTDQLGDAVGREEHLVANLKGLLELLQSEDRRHQLEEEKKWLESLRKEVEKLSAREKELRKATETRGAGQPLAERQRNIGRDANSLVQKIDKQDAARRASEDRRPPGKKDASRESPKDRDQNRKPDEKSPNPSEKNGSEKSESSKDKNKNTESKNGNSDKKDQKNQGKPSQDKSQQQANGESPPQEQQPGQQANGSENTPPDESKSRKSPGREEIEQARRAMQQAEDELKRLQADKALSQEDEAIRKLAEAKAQLEKILRKLREEEQEIMLRSLEARFAKMLVMQLQVHVDTVTLAKTAKNNWTTRHFGRSRELSVTEDAIALEAAKALKLLKEEGSSVAFPKGVEQVRDDMLTIARRLERNDVGELTQTIEKEVIESLEELLAALQAEIENRKKPQEQRQRGQAGRQQDDALVKELSELKMLRSLQLRVNRRTKLIGRMIKGEQAATDDLVDQLRKLARRQAEIQEATYILASGRNR